MLEVKIKYIENFIQARQQVATIYDQLYEKTGLCQAPVRTLHSTHVFQQYVLKVPRHLRDSLKLHLQGHFIPSMVYYPQPLHLQEAFRHLNYKVGDLPVAEAVARSVLALPMHSELTEEQQAYIVQHTVDFMAKQA